MIKNFEVYERALIEGSYMIETKATIRQTAKVFKISKTTVHKDLTNILFECDRDLYKKVQERLHENKYLGQLRGGESTKQKHLKK